MYNDFVDVVEGHLYVIYIHVYVYVSYLPIRDDKELITVENRYLPMYKDVTRSKVKESMASSGFQYIKS